MADVSCRAVGALFTEARAKKISFDLLTKDVPFSAEHLLNAQEWVTWDAYRQVIANAQQIWSDEELAQMGGKFLESPVFRPFAVFARLLFSAKDFYRWGFGRPDGPQLFTCVSTSYEEIGG